MKTADEIEELLIEEMRRLGNTTLTEWAMQAEQRVGQELKAREPEVLKRKKNADLVVHSFHSIPSALAVGYQACSHHTSSGLLLRRLRLWAVL